MNQPAQLGGATPAATSTMPRRSSCAVQTVGQGGLNTPLA